MARSIANSILAVFCTFLLTVTLRAQSTMTRLEGDVQDNQGRPTAGVTISALEDHTGLRTETVSDDEGHFVFPALPPSIYTLSAKANGFKQKVRKQVSLLLPGTVRESFVLHPGDSVAIESDIAAGDHVNPSDSQHAQAFSRRDLEAFPLLMRNPLSLVLYQPGVQMAVNGDGLSVVNGTRQGSNEVALDGLATGDPVNPQLNLSLTGVNTDSIQVLRLVTAGAQAEYGRVAGVHAMLISRSGDKTWSGSIFDYFRHKALNANDFFNNAANIPNPKYHQNNFGAALSGPISDRTFLFADFEGRRTDRRVTQNQTVPTASLKTGLFQWYAPGTSTLQSYDIVANDPRRLGIDRQVGAMLAQLPDPNNTRIGDGLNISGYSFSAPVSSRTEQATVRLDSSPSSAHHWFLRANWNHIHATDVENNAQARFAGQPEGIQAGHGWGAAAGLDWNLSATAVNELRVGYSQSATNLNRNARSASPMLLPNSWTAPLDTSFARSYSSPVFEASDHFTLSRNNHLLKFGGTFRRTLQKSMDTSGIYADVTFGRSSGNAPSAAIGPNGNVVIGALDRQKFESFYNDLLGRIESVTQTFNSNLSAFLPAGTPRSRSFAYQEYAAFVQDDWHIRPNFVFNLGLRYEMASAPSERDGLQAALDLAAQVTATANNAGLSYVPGKALYAKDLNNFAPRVGFAWNFPKRKMVLRGGYGLTHDRLSGAVTNFLDRNTPPLAQTVAVFPNLAGTDIRLSDGIPVPVAPSAPVLKLPVTRSASAVIFDDGLRTPYVHQFHLGVQKELFPDTILEAAYVGSRGEKLFMDLNRNQTKIEADFLQAFNQIRAYRATGAPVPASNTLVKLFGSPNAAISAVGGAIIDSGQVGVAANTVDRNNFARYAAAGLSDFYLRNFPQFNDLISGTNSGHSSYDSLQVNLRRSKQSYMVSAHYTWSKSFDNGSASGAAYVPPADSFNPSGNKAFGDLDRRKTLSVLARYSMPFGKNQRLAADMPGVMDAIIGGWNLGLLGIWQSGAPFSVSSGLQTAQAGTATLADYSGSRTPEQVLRATNGIFAFTQEQIQAFTVPPPGGRGTSGRNSFLGPNYINLDVSLFKNFRLRESRHFVFRGEIFNIFNRAQFGLPATDLADPSTFGRITATRGNPRIIQAALRFEF